MADYDLVVIGAGPGGYVAAIRGAQKGLKVAVVEKEHAGGSCLNRGCVPTKALLHSSNLYREIKHAGQFGLNVDNVEADMVKFYANKNRTVETLRGGVEQLFKANKIDLYRGLGSLTSATTVKVSGEDETVLNAKNIIVATGSKPRYLADEFMQFEGVYTSDDILGTEAIDLKKVIIIGAGVIGLEFASFYSDLGVDITVTARTGITLAEREISQNLSMILKKRGMKFEDNADLKKIEKIDGGLKCTFDQKGQDLVLECDGLIAAVGRVATTEGLFDGFELDMERGTVVVNEYGQTSAPNIYAIGDCSKGSIQLAHAASAQGMNVISHIMGEKPAVDMSVVPACIYTEPEIAMVGLTADAAKEKGIPVKTGKYIMSGNAKSILSLQERGFIKVVANAETDEIIGAQLMCARATDMIGEMATAIVNKLKVHDLSKVIRPHPTFGEGITEALEDVDKMAVHIAPKVKL